MAYSPDFTVPEPDLVSGTHINPAGFSGQGSSGFVRHPDNSPPGRTGGSSPQTREDRSLATNRLAPLSGARPFSARAASAAEAAPAIARQLRQAARNGTAPADISPAEDSPLVHPMRLPRLFTLAGAPWTSRRRVIEALLERADWNAAGWKDGSPIPVQMTDAELSQRMGVSRATAQRHLAAAIQAGLIRHIHYPDWSRRRLDLSPLIACLPDLLQAVADTKARAKSCSLAMTRLRQAVARLHSALSALEQSSHLPPDLLQELAQSLEDRRQDRRRAQRIQDPAILEKLAGLAEEQAAKAELHLHPVTDADMPKLAMDQKSGIGTRKMRPVPLKMRHESSLTNPVYKRSLYCTDKQKDYFEMIKKENMNETNKKPENGCRITNEHEAFRLFSALLPSWENCIHQKEQKSGAAFPSVLENTDISSLDWQNAVTKHGRLTAMATIVLAILRTGHRSGSRFCGFLTGAFRKHPAGSTGCDFRDCLNPWPSLYRIFREQSRLPEKAPAILQANGSPFPQALPEITSGPVLPSGLLLQADRLCQDRPGDVRNLAVSLDQWDIRKQTRERLIRFFPDLKSEISLMACKAGQNSPVRQKLAALLLLAEGGGVSHPAEI